MAGAGLRRGVLVGTPSLVLAGLLLALASGPSGPPAPASPGAPVIPTAATSPAATSAAPRPSPTAAASPSVTARRTIVIQGVGDVSLDPRYLPILLDRGWTWPWSGLGGIFRRDDLTVVNLECPATTVVDPVVKTFNFRCDPLALPAMRAAGVEVANQANNHAFDQEERGLLDSLVQVRAAGIATVGAGRTLREAMAPAVVEVGGWRIAVVGIGQVLDPPWMIATADRPGTTNGHDTAQVLATIRRAAAVSDLVVVAIHWGIELDTAPRAYQVALAAQMVAAGADVIFGHHAHRLQPLELVGGRPVFYGLGNFVWPRLSTAGATTAVARVVVHPDGTIEAELLPATIVENGHPVLDGPPA
jgi:poly-gamma-glutamate capsule biosynthesis protein CapA/YwtB (metallophosphatase superfamily)